MRILKTKCNLKSINIKHWIKYESSDTKIWQKNYLSSITGIYCLEMSAFSTLEIASPW